MPGTWLILANQSAVFNSKVDVLRSKTVDDLLPLSKYLFVVAHGSIWVKLWCRILIVWYDVKRETSCMYSETFLYKVSEYSLPLTMELHALTLELHITPIRIPPFVRIRVSQPLHVLPFGQLSKWLGSYLKWLYPGTLILFIALKAFRTELTYRGHFY